MNAEFTPTELQQRLEQLDQHLAAAANRIMEGGASTAEQQRRIEILRLKSSLLRQRLQEAKSSAWDDARASLQADWDALSENLERWMEDIDRDFQQGLRRRSP
jgi:uncharacterized coiled-coil protein SlyX